MAATPITTDAAETGPSGPLRRFWRAEMTIASDKPQPETAPQTASVIVFGRDKMGKAHASWFDQSEAALAEKAAGLMNLRVLTVKTDEHRALAAQFPRGRVFATGRAFVPFVKSSLFLQLQSAAQGAADASSAAPAPGDQAPADEPVKAEPPSPGGDTPAEQPAKAEPEPSPAKPNRERPRTWSDIQVGHMVLAAEAYGEGWWEARVVQEHEGKFTLTWRDWPELPRFARHRWQLALLHPTGRN